ncbi:MAG TPA: MraY family glycosyltransferase [Candidatus Dormibacteraeota bacterium]|nr:MraY family glycosyltransferase [Candidatus Dormibacteraeota bacterium]
MWILFDVACIAFLFSLVLTPLVRDTGLRFGLIDRPDSERKLHKGAIPRIGGVAVMIAYVLALVVILFVPYGHLTIDRGSALKGALALAPAVVVIFAIGIVDDIIGLRPYAKIAAEVLASVLAFAGGFGIHVLRGHPMEFWASLTLTVVWLVACSNAVNLIDGMDGLATGVGFFASLTALVAALMHHNIELALVTAPLVGSLLGFLKYNFNPASIFLGDSGSLLIGFLLGCYGALWSHKTETLLGMVAPMMALAFPLLEVGVSIVRRFVGRKPIFTADRNHIHHRLLDQGFTPRRAALLLYGGCGITAALSLLQELSYQRVGGMIILVFCFFAWRGIRHLGYTEFRVMGHLLFRDSIRKMINIQVHLKQFEKTLESAPDLESRWKLIAGAAKEFGFLAVRMRAGNEAFDSAPLAMDTTGLWQLRIPLPNSEYINLFRDPAVEMHPAVLNDFSAVVHNALSKVLMPAGRASEAENALPANMKLAPSIPQP